MSDEKGKSLGRESGKPRAFTALPEHVATPRPGQPERNTIPIIQRSKIGNNRLSHNALRWHVELHLPKCPELTGADMAIFSVYVVNKAGGLIYQLDHYAPRSENEKTFSFPLDLVLKLHDERVVVAFGQRDSIRVGHAVLSINGIDVNGKYTADGKEVLEYLGNPTNYPVSIRFGRPRLSSNEKLMLASMFHSLFAIGSQLSPELGSSGIEMLETDTFKLHCFQTLTGIKFVVLADPRQAGIESLLRKIYEIYSDFALKNPFYSLEMPIRCELFDQNLKLALEVAEKAGPFGPGS
ncbi:trafficking protein particle complex subunit 4 [Terrapene carolina triunguis]|nr:trafficking protein particle complex subunit 4 [Terrapene carolina triunguis]